MGDMYDLGLGREIIIVAHITVYFTISGTRGSTQNKIWTLGF